MNVHFYNKTVDSVDIIIRQRNIISYTLSAVRTWTTPTLIGFKHARIVSSPFYSFFLLVVGSCFAGTPLLVMDMTFHVT